MKQATKGICTIILCTLLVIATNTAWAEEPKQMDETELAKAAQNPIANMISIKVESSFDFRFGADKDKSQIVTDIKPLVPISLNKE